MSFESKIQKHDSHFTFSKVFWFVLVVPLNILSKVKGSGYLTLNSSIQNNIKNTSVNMSEELATNSVLSWNFELKMDK